MLEPSGRIMACRDTARTGITLGRVRALASLCSALLALALARGRGPFDAVQQQLGVLLVRLGAALGDNQRKGGADHCRARQVQLLQSCRACTQSLQHLRLPRETTLATQPCIELDLS